LRLRRPRGQHKLDCAKCGGEKEPEMVGKEAYCKKCKAEYLREYRATKNQLINKALEFYKQHSGQD
jgi:hypothetical protein